MKKNTKYCPEIKSRWNNYNTYRFMVWAWTMNEIAIVSAPVDISHTGFYAHSVIYVIVSIFVGIPLVYSEICIAQYTNCDMVSTWNFCPILRGVGFGTFFLIILKIAYLLVLSSWYLEYTFAAAFDPPPWFSCAEYDDPKCMVKRVNVSIFQNCIEAQTLFNEDCGMKTASSCYFEKKIGNNNTKLTNCIHVWKTILISLIFTSTLFVILIKKEKVLKVIVRILAVYVVIVLVTLFCVALSTSGTWYATKIGIKWEDLDFKYSIYISTQSAHACGVGCGIIGFLSRDVPFRSPATMTAVTTPLFSLFITLMFALIIFSGIKSVSYYHGEEQNILEIGDSIFFNSFASIAEVLSYFNGLPLWAFIWFSTIFICLLVNIVILCLFLFESLTINSKIARKYKNICCIGIQVRIHGYSQRRNVINKKSIPNLKMDHELLPEHTEWSALTSN
ncbi:sodium-dependent noradrenaline transporter-like [Vanessa tameamea]|uniref:Sodium-dependent noradrenaline transporter-like n=1 Tax=Vanessa tameamea TaxID=334116 RepID=A0ABM4AKX7_VANTA